MIPFFYVKHVNNGIETDLSNYIESIQVTKVTEAKKNNITLNLFNPNKKLNDISFERDDSTITLYVSWNNINRSNPTQTPIMIGNIESIKYSVDDKGKNKLKIKALDKTGLFLSKLWSFAYTDSTPNPYSGGEGLAVHEAIKHIINSSQDNPGAGDKITFNNLSSTDSDGNTFTKNVNIAKTWKPIYEWLNELSTTDYTEDDRAYIYYLDENNDLHWEYPSQKIQTVLEEDLDSTETEIDVADTSSYPSSGVILIEDEQIEYTGISGNTFTGCTRGANGTVATTHSDGTSVSGQALEIGQDNIYNMDVDTDGEGEYTMIIYNAGQTPAGYEYLWYALDESRLGEQVKMKFYDWKDIGQSTFNTEKTWTDPVTGYTWGNEDSDYPTPNGSELSESNPWHPSWDSSLSITSNSEYQDEFINNLKDKGGSKAKDFFATGAERFKGEVEMKGTLSYKVNDLINVYQIPQGVTKRLRVKEIRHMIGKSGWFTTLSLDTDPEAR